MSGFNSATSSHMRGVSILSSETLMPSSPLQQEPNRESAHHGLDDSQRDAEKPPYTPETQERIGYKHFLDLLDFKRGTKMRQQFLSLLIEHHDTPERRYLRNKDGDEFTALVNGFLDEHGARFFGKRQRSHLVMSDPAVGLLYDRDAGMKESYLWRTLADFFHWRSYCAAGGKRSHKRPASPDRHPLLAESSDDKANEGDRPQTRRPSKPEPETQPEPSVTQGREQGHAREPLKRRGRPRIRPDSPDGHRITEGQAQGRAPNPLRRRGRPRLRPETPDGHQITEGQSKDHARKPLRRRGRPRTRQESRDGHPITEDHGQDNVQVNDAHRRESPPPHRRDGDRRHRNREFMSPAQSSQSTISPETPDIPARRASQPTFVGLASSEDKDVKPELSDADCYETTATDFQNPIFLPTKILNNTNLLVRVSNQPNVAPAFVNLRLCRNLEILFPVLMAECDVQASSVMKITKISVTFPWNREELRLRKGRREDWVVFCEALRQRWQNSEVVNGGNCRVEMLVHVDD